MLCSILKKPAAITAESDVAVRIFAVPTGRWRSTVTAFTAMFRRVAE